MGCLWLFRKKIVKKVKKERKEIVDFVFIELKVPLTKKEEKMYSEENSWSRSQEAQAPVQVCH